MTETHAELQNDALPKAVLKYLVKGVRTTRDGQADLQQELRDLLPNANSIVVQPVVQGFSVEIEMSDLHPFTADSFEPYVAEHVLPEAVNIRCETTDTVELLLLKNQFK